MNIMINWPLLNKARYNMKIRKLCKKMADCMTEADMMNSVESTEKVLRLLPDPLKEQLIDKLISTIDETSERFGWDKK